MPGLGPGIHVFLAATKTWMATELGSPSSDVIWTPQVG